MNYKVIPKRQDLDEDETEKLIKAMVKFLEREILDYTVFEPGKEDFEDAVEILKQIQAKNVLQRDITLNDLLLVTLCKNNDFILVSGEKKVLKLAREYGVVVNK